MATLSDARFKQDYASHLKHLKLKGLQPKTIDAYSRAIRRIGKYFDYQIDSLSEPQLTDFFSQLLADGSWSTVKLDLYGLKFYYEHVLRKPWVAPGLIKPPKSQRLLDIITIDEAGRIFAATHILSYRVFFFTLYSLGLRLGEGLRLQVGDIDAVRARVHISDAKGNRDRLVPLPQATHQLLQRFWLVHRNPVLLFPSRQGGMARAKQASTHMDPGGVQTALHKVVEACGLKKDHAAQPAPLSRVQDYSETYWPVPCIKRQLSKFARHSFVTSHACGVTGNDHDSDIQGPVRIGRFRPDDQLLAFLNGL